MLACVVLAISLGVVSGQFISSPFHYPESLANGWGGLCETGTKQSPIDLDPDMVPTVHAPITYKNYFNCAFNKLIKGALFFNGATVIWWPKRTFQPFEKLYGGKHWRLKCPSIRDGPFAGVKYYAHTYIHNIKAYYLLRVEFHWGTVGNNSKGSEHTFGGMQYPLEMQMVHIKDEFIKQDGTVDYLKVIAAIAAGKEKVYAVLSILFKVDNKKPQNMEPLEKIDDIVWDFHYHHGGHKNRSAEELEEAELEHTHNMNMRSLMNGFNGLNKAKREKREASTSRGYYVTLNIGAFIRKATNNGKDKTMSTYWTYQGSETVPGCYEDTTWVVFERSLAISQVQANAFPSLYPSNFRAARNATMEHNVQYLVHKPVGGC